MPQAFVAMDGSDFSHSIDGGVGAWSTSIRSSDTVRCEALRRFSSASIEGMIESSLVFLIAVGVSERRVHTSQMRYSSKGLLLLEGAVGVEGAKEVLGTIGVEGAKGE